MYSACGEHYARRLGDEKQEMDIEESELPYANED